MSPEIARIIDANINRAREALRVMEDYARFVLGDPAGCQVLKGLRHDFVEQIRRLPDHDLLTARDTPGDVGTRITTSAESHRHDAAEVFTAAAKRLPEALRTIEEYVKTENGSLASTIEALRYRAYDIEQRLALRGDRSARFARVKLYVLVTASMCKGDWLETTAAVIRGGADCIQLREKGLDDGELLAQARQLTALCRKHGVVSIINDRPDIAALADADGVHLGQTDMSIADARRIVGPSRLIGLSTHTPEQLREAIAQLPDYVAVGPIFPSSTKPQDHVPGTELLALAERETDLPVVPVGGISVENINILIQAGARRSCVCSAVICEDEPEHAARALRRTLTPATE